MTKFHTSPAAGRAGARKKSRIEKIESTNFNEFFFIVFGQFDQKRNFRVVLPGNVFYHDRPRSGSSQGPYVSGAIVPL
ncbi:MAG: hypothetical protein K9K88_15140, partial [Desulfobacterales bacterium]|nr:hypothetical protein [Desulfobacterales bacterium]